MSGFNYYLICMLGLFTALPLSAHADEPPETPLDDIALAYSLGSVPGVDRRPGILAPPIYDETYFSDEPESPDSEQD